MQRIEILKEKKSTEQKLGAAAVAQSVERPEIRSLNELQLSDRSMIPGCGIRW